MSPEDIVGTEWDKHSAATVVAPSLPTCFANTYDFVVVSQSPAPVFFCALHVWHQLVMAPSNVLW